MLIMLPAAAAAFTISACRAGSRFRSIFRAVSSKGKVRTVKLPGRQIPEPFGRDLRNDNLSR